MAGSYAADGSYNVTIVGGSAGGGGGGGTGDASAANQTTGNNYLLAIRNATGNTDDAASASGAVSTIVGALKAIRDKLLGSLAVTGTFFQALQPVDTVVKVVATSRSGVITTGGTSQSFAAANAARRGFVIQNQSTGDLRISGLASATLDNNSLLIPAGAYYETPVHHVGTSAISIIGATTGQAFYAREF